MYNKCIDNNYLDFLLYLNTFEINNLKMYDLLKAILAGSIDIGSCYRELARVYLALESIIGDPTLALFKTGEIIRGDKFSRFLKGYGSILGTTGDTLTYANSALREELNTVRVKVSESLRLLEILYEAILVSILGISLLVLIPLSDLIPIIGLSALWVLGILSYILSYRILAMVYLDIPRWVATYDLILISLAYPLVHSRYGYLVYLTLLLGSIILLEPLKRRRVNNDKEVVRIFNDIYSYSMLGEPVDIALLRALEKTETSYLNYVRFLLTNGFNAAHLISRLDLSNLSRKIMLFLTSTLTYSGHDNKFLAPIRMILDEITSTRRLVFEKARFFMLYTIVLVIIVSFSYMMIQRIPGLHWNPDLMSALLFLNVLDATIPVSVIRDGGFSYSRTSLVILSIASLISLIVFHL